MNDPGNNLTEKERIELARLLERRGCPSCGAVGIGAHCCPGPKRDPIDWRKTIEDKWKKGATP